MSTQQSTVHIADKAAPNDVDRWQELGPEHHRLFKGSEFYLLQRGGRWPNEWWDLGKLSEQFDGVLFVSDSIEDGERWRVFALDGQAEWVLPELVWPVPANYQENLNSSKPAPERANGADS